MGQEIGSKIVLFMGRIFKFLAIVPDTHLIRLLYSNIWMDFSPYTVMWWLWHHQILTNLENLKFLDRVLQTLYFGTKNMCQIVKQDGQKIKQQKDLQPRPGNPFLPLAATPFFLKEKGPIKIKEKIKICEKKNGCHF